MSALAATDVALLAHRLPGCLDRERQLLPSLWRLGVAEGDLRILEGDQHLLRILAEESEEPSAEASRRELLRIAAWHERRLERVAAEAREAPSQPARSR